MASTSLLSNTNPVPFKTAEANAKKLITAFKTGPVSKSTHYPYLGKIAIVKGLEDTLKNSGQILAQKNSSLCGPAAFFFSLVKIRPDIYVELVIDLYTNGKSSLKNLKLQSSQRARNHKPIRLSAVDWLLLSSIKPKYDHPDEQFDGITLPGKLKSWFIDAGFTSVVDNTNIFSNKNLKTLLEAQRDFKNGYKICLFVDADIFKTKPRKNGPSPFPNHWVVMNSDITISKYNEKTKKHAAATIINQSTITTINNQIKAIEDTAFLDNDDEDDVSTETYDRILLNAFTWGGQNTSVQSTISRSQNARLSYFLNGFYGYVKAKR